MAALLILDQAYSDQAYIFSMIKLHNRVSSSKTNSVETVQKKLNSEPRKFSK